MDHNCCSNWSTAASNAFSFVDAGPGIDAGVSVGADEFVEEFSFAEEDGASDPKSWIGMGEVMDMSQRMRVGDSEDGMMRSRVEGWDRDWDCPYADEIDVAVGVAVRKDILSPSDFTPSRCNFSMARFMFLFLFVDQGEG